ncbi:MAG: hypothetical protein WAU47_02035 [Desulfobaccales bacterium]
MPKKNRLLVIIPSVLILLLILAAAAFFGLEYYVTTALKKEIDYHIQEIREHVKVDYDSLGVNWLNFTVNMKNVRLWKPPLPGMVTIDRVGVRDFTTIGVNWIPTRILLDNIALSNEDVRIGIERLNSSFTLKRVPTEDEIEKDWKVILDNLLSGKLNLTNISLANEEGQVAIGDISTDFSVGKNEQKNLDLAINGINLQKDDIRFNSGTLNLAIVLTRDNVLNRLSKRVKDLSFQFPPHLAQGNPLLQQLSGLGYDRLNVSLDLDYDYQPDTKNLNFMWNGSAQDMGRLQFDVHLTDFTSPPLPTNGSLADILNYLEQLQIPAQKASLQGVAAVYQDFGLAPRLIKAEAQAQGQTPEDFVQNLVGSINGYLFLMPLPAALKEQVYAVNRFLVNPKEIQAAITFKKPVRLKNLQEGSISALLELVGNTDIKITSK